MGCTLWLNAGLKERLTEKYKLERPKKWSKAERESTKKKEEEARGEWPCDIGIEEKEEKALDKLW